jgi:hypothetical protein
MNASAYVGMNSSTDTMYCSARGGSSAKGSSDVPTGKVWKAISPLSLSRMNAIPDRLTLLRRMSPIRPSNSQLTVAARGEGGNRSGLDQRLGSGSTSVELPRTRPSTASPDLLRHSTIRLQRSNPYLSRLPRCSQARRVPVCGEAVSRNSETVRPKFQVPTLLRPTQRP